jgi:hypothetical protein
MPVLSHLHQLFCGDTCHAYGLGIGGGSIYVNLLLVSMISRHMGA